MGGLDNAWWGGVFVEGWRLTNPLSALVRGLPVHTGRCRKPCLPWGKRGWAGLLVLGWAGPGVRVFGEKGMTWAFSGGGWPGSVRWRGWWGCCRDKAPEMREARHLHW
ncbi:hypothetical protein MABM_22100 [Mycobacteroides abscessus]|nr:hypothetical protein MABM_22100 [Mycobacteroides abscessus]